MLHKYSDFRTRALKYTRIPAPLVRLPSNMADSNRCYRHASKFTSGARPLYSVRAEIYSCKARDWLVERRIKPLIPGMSQSKRDGCHLCCQLALHLAGPGFHTLVTTKFGQIAYTTACLFFYHFACAMGYCDWSSDKGLCSEFVHVGCGVIK